MSNTTIFIISFLSTYLGMEFVAWFTHKYIMHGFLWSWHESHHSPRNGIFEKNDRFFLVYATAAIILMFLGHDPLDYRFFLGLGITAYGLTYFLLHDVFIHRRAKWFDRLNSPYLTAMRKAHKAHHKSMGKNGCIEFGLLLFNKRFFKI
ncbi:MAG: hypothetical protein RIQ89_370 [Bacteroidota bacterium]|jgi:beta-carotene 3-hydroxylase